MKVGATVGSATVNLGDIIYQLIMFGMIFLFITLLTYFWHSSKRKKEQLNRIEEKLDALEKKNS